MAQMVPVSALRLDDSNARLPEELRGRPPEEILNWFYNEGVLEELAISFLDHGYFSQEPLFAVAEADGTWTVIEGNRRLAALAILRQLDPAIDAGLSFPFVDEVSDSRLDRLAEVPVNEVESRDDLREFLGFRHIGGLKEWPPEAKARWIETEIARRTTEVSGENIFRDVARSVGTNTQSIRGPYLALRIMRYALDELDEGDDLSAAHFVRRERFGVLVRATNSPDLRQFIAPTSTGGLLTLDDINSYMSTVDTDRLSRVLSDMAPRPGHKTPLLADSRDVTTYARALQHPIASTVLTKYGDLALAKQILDREDLPNRLQTVERTVRAILDEIQRDLDDLPPESLDAALALKSAVDSLVVQVQHRPAQ